MRTLSEEEMKALAERSLELWNTGDMDLADELWDTSFVRHEVDINEDIVGIDAFKESVSSLRAAFPDFNVTFVELLIMGDRTASRWIVTGTNTGPGALASYTGNKVAIHGASVVLVRNGKIVEEWVYYNLAAVLAQLGYTITPPTAEEEQ